MPKRDIGGDHLHPSLRQRQGYALTDTSPMPRVLRVFLLRVSLKYAAIAIFEEVRSGVVERLTRHPVPQRQFATLCMVWISLVTVHRYSGKFANFSTAVPLDSSSVYPGRRLHPAIAALVNTLRL